MNVPIRRLGTLVALLFALLLGASSYIMAIQGQDIRERPGNRRTQLNSFNVERGAILVDGDPIATSKATTNDELKWQRVYAEGPRYAHVTGYTSFIYGSGGGLERAADSLLAGTDDSLFIRRLVDMVTGKPRQGASLELTLDPKMQRAADEALGDHEGAVVALDAQTGEILALVSHPTYDPNSVTTNDTRAQQAAMEKLVADDSRPVSNRALAELYPPGSTFKVITAAAALSSGQAEPDAMLDAPDRLKLPGTSYRLRNYGGKSCSPTGKLSLADSLRISCNTSFAGLAIDLGVDKMAAQTTAFGFGKDLELPMRVAGSQFPTDIDKAALGMAGIGQHSVRVTPLQVAMMSAGVVNNGVVMKPYLVKSVRTASLETIDETRPEEFSRAVAPEVATQLTDMMVNVVENGSGSGAQIRGVRVGGKTGTAEYGNDGKAHAWFTGFSDGERKIAVAVLVEGVGQAGDLGTGGRVAAPIARAVLQAGQP